MKPDMLSTGKQFGLKIPFFALPAMGGAIAAIHIGLVLESNDESLIPLSLLFWLSVGALIWQKRHCLELHSDTFSVMLGGLLLGVFLFWGFANSTDSYLAAGPFAATLGVAIVCSGWRRLMQYRSELLLMFMFGVPKALLWPVLDLRETTARFSTAMLHLANFDVLRDGRVISLPTGAVEVIQDCSGLNGVLYLLSIGTLLLIMVPLKGTKQYLVPIVGVAIAYIINGVRVAFLAIIAANPDPALFQKWHGTSIFSLAALGLFCTIYCLLLWQENHAVAKRS